MREKVVKSDPMPKENKKVPSTGDVSVVLGAFLKRRSFRSRSALWFHLGRRMPYGDLKAVLELLEREGVVHTSKGKISIRELPQLAKVRMGQKTEAIEDPAQEYGPLLVYYKKGPEQHITSSTADIEFMKALRARFRKGRSLNAGRHGEGK